MITPPVLAAVAAACLTAGLVLVVAGLVGTRRPPRPPSPLGVWLLAVGGAGLPPRARRRRRVVAASTIAATAAGWLVTGWPVGGLITGMAAMGAPWLVSAGSAEKQMIARLEAVEVWTRRLADLVRTGHGLISAIVTSARTAPAAITEQVADLAAELRAGADPQLALDTFADALADAKADEVIAALKLHAGDRGQRLSDVLVSVAVSAGEEVVMRRRVAAQRAEPRFVTRFMTGLIAVVLVVVFTNTTYATPYGTLIGQLVLLAATLLLIGMLVWIRALTQPARPSRFLAASTVAPTDPPARTSSAVLSLMAGRR